MYRTPVVCLEADAVYASKGGGFGEEVGVQQLRWCPGPDSNRHGRKAEGF